MSGSGAQMGRYSYFSSIIFFHWSILFSRTRSLSEIATSWMFCMGNCAKETIKARRNIFTILPCRACDSSSPEKVLAIRKHKEGSITMIHRQGKASIWNCGIRDHTGLEKGTTRKVASTNNSMR